MTTGGAHTTFHFTEAIMRLFRERQVYIRCDQALRFVVVRPWHQVAAAGVCAVGVVWLAASAITLVYKSAAVSNARDKTERVQTLYDGHLATMESTVERLNEKLMLNQKTYVGRVEDLRTDFDRLIDRQRRLEVFFKQGWLPERALEDDPEEAIKAHPEPKPQSMNSKADRLIIKPAAGVALLASSAPAEQPLTAVRKSFARFKDRQLKLVASIVAFSESRAARLRKLFEAVGLDPKKVAAGVNLQATGLGGPLLTVQSGHQPRDALDRQFLEAHQRFLEAEKLRYAVTTLPIRLPFAKGYRLTSGFGFRRDPFKDVLAMHTGVDLMTPYGTPIKATAAGVVIRAEMSDVYGRVVDIQHDNAITTRYAHMSAMDVEVGDRIAVGQMVGRVGTSGRSTGPHLHYETRVDGNAIDPYEFLRVARNVVQEETQ